VQGAGEGTLLPPLPAQPGARGGLPAPGWVAATRAHPAAQAAASEAEERKAPLCVYHPVYTGLDQQMCDKDPGIIMSVLSNSCCLHPVRSRVVLLPPSVPSSSSSSPPSSGGAGKGHSHVPHAALVLFPMVAPLRSQAALSRRGQ